MYGKGLEVDKDKCNRKMIRKWRIMWMSNRYMIRNSRVIRIRKIDIWQG